MFVGQFHTWARRRRRGYSLAHYPDVSSDMQKYTIFCEAYLLYSPTPGSIKTDFWSPMYYLWIKSWTLYKRSVIALKRQHKSYQTRTDFVQDWKKKSKKNLIGMKKKWLHELICFIHTWEIPPRREIWSWSDGSQPEEYYGWEIRRL